MEENFDGDFALPSEENMAKMQQEYSQKGITAGRNISRIDVYPLPVYTLDKCFDFCKAVKEVCAIFSQLDKIFVSRNKKEIDFIISCVEKNRIVVANKADIMQDIFLPRRQMPIKQSMYRLLELFNSMSMTLETLTVYEKSVEIQEVITRHLLACSVFHSICI